MQNTEVIVEEIGSNNNEDIVSESLIDGEIINEIKKINDKLRCEGNIELEGSNDMEENQNIKMRQKSNSSDVHCIKTKRCCDVWWNSGLWVY